MANVQGFDHLWCVKENNSRNTYYICKKEDTNIKIRSTKKQYEMDTKVKIAGNKKYYITKCSGRRREYEVKGDGVNRTYTPSSRTERLKHTKKSSNEWLEYVKKNFISGQDFTPEIKRLSKAYKAQKGKSKKRRNQKKKSS